MKELALTIPKTGGGSFEINPVGGMPEGGTSAVQNLVQWGLNFIFIAAILLSLAFLLFGGIKWITSGGDKNGIQSARQMIIYALIGLVVVFMSVFIIRIIGNLFGIELLNLPSSGGPRRPPGRGPLEF
jgi:hypothetical protein